METTNKGQSRSVREEHRTRVHSATAPDAAMVMTPEEATALVPIELVHEFLRLTPPGFFFDKDHNVPGGYTETQVTFQFAETRHNSAHEVKHGPIAEYLLQQPNQQVRDIMRLHDLNPKAVELVASMKKLSPLYTWAHTRSIMQAMKEQSDFLQFNLKDPPKGDFIMNIMELISFGEKLYDGKSFVDMVKRPPRQQTLDDVISNIQQVCKTHASSSVTPTDAPIANNAKARLHKDLQATLSPVKGDNYSPYVSPEESSLAQDVKASLKEHFPRLAKDTLLSIEKGAFEAFEKNEPIGFNKLFGGSQDVSVLRLADDDQQQYAPRLLLTEHGQAVIIKPTLFTPFAEILSFLMRVTLFEGKVTDDDETIPPSQHRSARTHCFPKGTCDSQYQTLKLNAFLGVHSADALYIFHHLELKERMMLLEAHGYQASHEQETTTFMDKEHKCGGILGVECNVKNGTMPFALVDSLHPSLKGRVICQRCYQRCYHSQFVMRFEGDAVSDVPDRPVSETNDVLSGSGFSQRPANLRFRQMLTDHYDGYKLADYKGKKEICDQLMKEWFRIGGRFLDKQQGQDWNVMREWDVGIQQCVLQYAAEGIPGTQSGRIGWQQPIPETTRSCERCGEWRQEEGTSGCGGNQSRWWWWPILEATTLDQEKTQHKEECCRASAYFDDSDHLKLIYMFLLFALRLFVLPKVLSI